MLPGRYCSNNVSLSGTLLHCPYTSAGFTLNVGFNASSAYLWQEIRSRGAGVIYYRTYSNGVWNGWKTVLTDADIPDSGWIPCTLKSGITTASNNYGGKAKLSYRKIGNQVHIAGGVGITNYTGNTIISSLPSAYRPETTHYWLSPLTGSRISR